MFVDFIKMNSKELLYEVQRCNDIYAPKLNERNWRMWGSQVLTRMICQRFTSLKDSEDTDGFDLWYDGLKISMKAYNSEPIVGKNGKIVVQLKNPHGNIKKYKEKPFAEIIEDIDFDFLLLLQPQIEIYKKEQGRTFNYDATIVVFSKETIIKSFSDITMDKFNRQYDIGKSTKIEIDDQIRLIINIDHANCVFKERIHRKKINKDFLNQLLEKTIDYYIATAESGAIETKKQRQQLECF